MTTDFRALCAELTEFVARLTKHYYEPAELLTRARAALADESAVPEGREPVSVTGQPSDEDLWNTADLVFQANSWPKDAIRYARAVLARWGNPAPQPPAEGEVAELVQHLHHAAEVDDWDGASPEWCQSMLRAADLLERQAAPVPVPVSERLPEFSDCDDTDRVWCWNWAVGAWRLNRINRSIHTHWLPAHANALPLPEVE